MKTQRMALLLTLLLPGLTALGVSAATAQTELFFATGVDSTGRALAQSNADGHVLIESPQYPRGLWLHLVDEAGDALADIQVEYQGWPDSLVVLRCVDPAGGVRETLIWTRPSGDPLRLTLKPKKVGDLPAGLTPIDWQINLSVEPLLERVKKARLIGWEALEAFLRERWAGQTGRVSVRIKSSTTFTILAVEVDRPEAVEALVAHLQQLHQTAGVSLGENTTLIEVQVFRNLALLEDVIHLNPFFFEDAALATAVRRALGLAQGTSFAPEEAASLTRLGAGDSDIHSLVGLGQLAALQRLYLSENQIADLTPLAQLKNLEELYLSNNQITDVTPLTRLTNLQVLGLDDNQIEDLSPLVANPGLGEGDRIYLENNPLSAQARNEQIPALKARGVNVTY